VSNFSQQLKRANEIAGEIGLRSEIFDKDLKQIQEALELIRKTKISQSVDVWDDLQSSHLSHLAQMTQQFAVVKNIANTILASKVRIYNFCNSLEQNHAFCALRIGELVQITIKNQRDCWWSRCI
jgi:hypothetical protein